MIKTNELIATLASDLPRQRVRPGTAIAIAVVVAVIAAATVFFSTIGPRPDIAGVAQTYRFVGKFLVTGLLAVTSILLLDRLMRPGAVRWVDFVLLATAPAVLAIMAGIEAYLMPSSQWQMAAAGKNGLVCLTFVPLIGLGPLVAMIAALRTGAPTRPGLSGAVAGIVAGGISASFYAAHCTDDSPFFVAIWYPAAIVILAGLGFVLGRLFARF